MSAEQQKILWIIASIAFLIVIILGAGLWWFYPGMRGRDAVEVTGLETTSDATGPAYTDWVRTGDGSGQESFPGSTTPSENPSGTPLPSETAPSQEQPATGPVVVVIHNEGNTTTFGDTSGMNTAESAPSASTAPAPKEPAASETAVRPADKPAPSKAVPKQAQQKPSATATKQAPKPSPAKTVRVDEYWIQTASASSITQAEEAKAALLEKGLAPVIMPVTVNGKRFYRVRIGPYSSKPEADKFLEWVRAIKGFEKSYVSLVSVNR